MTAHKVAFRDSSKKNASAEYTLSVDLVPALGEYGSERLSQLPPTAPQPHSLSAPESLSHTAPRSYSPSTLSCIAPWSYRPGSYSCTVPRYL